MHADWLIPDWPVPANVHAVFTTRSGGVSVPPYDRLNLGEHVGDDLGHVQFNRNQLQQHIGARPVFMQQVHGVEVAKLVAQSVSGLVADAALTSETHLACTVMVADCLPILLTDRSGRLVGAAHAGWRGLCAGVIERTIAAMRTEQAGLASAELMAWLGPCIGSRAFEVGTDVRLAFEQAACANDSAQDIGRGFVPTSDGAALGKYAADLAGLARLRLRSAGVMALYGNDSSDAWCTVRHPSRFFSHRRDSAGRGGDVRSTGRMAACIWLS